MPRRIWPVIYGLCMLLALGISAAAIKPSTPSADWYTSIHPATAVVPLHGLAEDSVFNKGTAEQLDAFPGIGEVLSERIIEGRAIFGGYRLPEDLMLVKGIGPKKLAGMMEVLEESLVELPPADE